MAKIYSKSGDAGETGLVDGTRLNKASNVLDVYGTSDELNSQLGLLICSLSVNFDENELIRVQKALFQLGSLLACSPSKRKDFKVEFNFSNETKFLEERIDFYTDSLPILKNFILPGGTVCAAYAHLCRTTTRKLERKVLKLKQNDPSWVSDDQVVYLNRLSDYFFTYARWINFKANITEKNWP